MNAYATKNNNEKQKNQNGGNIRRTKTNTP